LSCAGKAGSKYLRVEGGMDVFEHDHDSTVTDNTDLVIQSDENAQPLGGELGQLGQVL
jgi:hypothetical protein